MAHKKKLLAHSSQSFVDNIAQSNKRAIHHVIHPFKKKRTIESLTRKKN